MFTYVIIVYYYANEITSSHRHFLECDTIGLAGNIVQHTWRNNYMPTTFTMEDPYDSDNNSNCSSLMTSSTDSDSVLSVLNQTQPQVNPSLLAILSMIYNLTYWWLHAINIILRTIVINRIMVPRLLHMLHHYPWDPMPLPHAYMY